MPKISSPFQSKSRAPHLPLVVEKDEDGFYVVECPLFEGCYSQGKTLDGALRNIREVIALILEEKESRSILKSYRPQESAENFTRCGTYAGRI